MPMLLKSEDGKEFELAIIPERLPESQDGHGDDETPMVSFRVATEEEEWEETSPGLGLTELRGLVAWLENLAAGGPGESEIDLLELELNFQVVKDRGDVLHLRIRFHLEQRPEEFAVDAETTEARHVDLRLRRSAIKSAAAQLRADIGEAARGGDEAGAEQEPRVLTRRPPEEEEAAGEAGGE